MEKKAIKKKLKYIYDFSNDKIKLKEESKTFYKYLLLQIKFIKKYHKNF